LGSYRPTGEYPDIIDLYYEFGEALFAAGDIEGAMELFVSLRRYPNADRRAADASALLDGGYLAQFEGLYWNQARGSLGLEDFFIHIENGIITYFPYRDEDATGRRTAATDAETARQLFDAALTQGYPIHTAPDALVTYDGAEYHVFYPFFIRDSRQRSGSNRILELRKIVDIRFNEDSTLTVSGDSASFSTRGNYEKIR